MSVIRHNTDTGRIALYASKADAGAGMPVYSNEKELAASKVSISELARFYNTMVPADKQVKTFRDKPTAVGRVWSTMQGQPQEVPEAKQPTAPKPAPAPTPVVETEAKKRGRQAGSGEFAGKTVFAKKDVNPRRIGTAGFKSFEIIRGQKAGVSYADYIKAGGRPNDLRWDIEHKWAEVK